MSHVSRLLHSAELEVSYFAAGVISHLTSLGEQAWTLSSIQRRALLDDLVGEPPGHSRPGQPCCVKLHVGDTCSFLSFAVHNSAGVAQSKL